MSTYTIIVPLVISAIIVGFYALIPVKPVLLGEKGLVSTMLTVVSTLPGFYFAGLAAVATFGAPSMDQVMPQPAPEIKIKVGPSWVENQLTRRLFLTYLFSYLVLVSFFICFVLVALNTGANSVYMLREWVEKMKHGQEIWFAIKASIGLPITFVFSSMIVTTMHGVFFLTEKIHQPS